MGQKKLSELYSTVAVKEGDLIKEGLQCQLTRATAEITVCSNEYFSVVPCLNIMSNATKGTMLGRFRPKPFFYPFPNFTESQKKQKS